MALFEVIKFSCLLSVCSRYNFAEMIVFGLVAEVVALGSGLFISGISGVIKFLIPLVWFVLATLVMLVHRSLILLSSVRSVTLFRHSSALMSVEIDGLVATCDVRLASWTNVFVFSMMLCQPFHRLYMCFGSGLQPERDWSLISSNCTGECSVESFRANSDGVRQVMIGK